MHDRTIKCASKLDYHSSSSSKAKQICEIEINTCCRLETANDWQAHTYAAREKWLEQMVRHICQSEQIFIGSRILPDIVGDGANRIQQQHSANDGEGASQRKLAALRASLRKAMNVTPKLLTGNDTKCCFGKPTTSFTRRLLVDLSAAPYSQVSNMKPVVLLNYNRNKRYKCNE